MAICKNNNMNNPYFKPLIIFACTIITILILLLLLIIPLSPPLPTCQEDQVLIGTGNFNNDRWSKYKCGPALDNFIDPDYLNFLLCIKNDPNCAHNSANPNPNKEPQ